MFVTMVTTDFVNHESFFYLVNIFGIGSNFCTALKIRNKLYGDLFVEPSIE